MLGGVGLFGFPIGLSLLCHLNNKGVIHIFRRKEEEVVTDTAGADSAEEKDLEIEVVQND
jgi:hypothetical protein